MIIKKDLRESNKKKKGYFVAYAAGASRILLRYVYVINRSKKIDLKEVVYNFYKYERSLHSIRIVFKEESYSKKKTFAPNGSNFFPLRIAPK